MPVGVERQQCLLELVGAGSVTTEEAVDVGLDSVDVHAHGSVDQGDAVFEVVGDCSHDHRHPARHLPHRETVHTALCDESDCGVENFTTAIAVRNRRVLPHNRQL